MKSKNDISECWYVYRPDKGYFYGPGAPVALQGKPVVFAEPLKKAEVHPESSNPEHVGVACSKL